MRNTTSSVGAISLDTMNNDNAMKINKVNYNAMNNDNVRGLIPKDQADDIADRLVQELNNPNYREFYCKVAYKLSESQIWNSLELAKNKGKDPARYFSWLVAKEMRAI